MLESAGISFTETELPLTETSASKTIVGMVGTAHKGPINTPVLINSNPQFADIFGEISHDSFGTYAAYNYLKEGNRLWYCRVANAANVSGGSLAVATASANFTNFSLHATTKGSWGNEISVKFSYDTQSGADPTLFNIEVYTPNSLGKKVLRGYHKGISLDPISPNYILKRMGTLSGDTATVGDSKYIVAKSLTSVTTRPAATADGTFLPLAGGESGLTPTIAEVVGTTVNGVSTGLQVFSSMEDMNVNVISMPGFTQPEHNNALIALAEARGDVLAILDPPFGQTVNDMVSWQLDYTSSRAAVYWPWVQVLSPDGQQALYVPPSAVVVSKLAYNDRVGEPWFAPAGWNRGFINNGINVEYNTTIADRDALQSDTNSVNPIIYVRGRGVAVWGQKTLARENSLVDRINVRRLVLYLRREIGEIATNLIFETNGVATWTKFRMGAEGILQNVQTARGINDYKVVVDSSTTTDEDIRNNRINAIIYIQPTESVEYISIDFTLAPLGVSF